MLAGYPFSEDSSDSEVPKRGLFEDSESTESEELDSQVAVTENNNEEVTVTA